MRYGSLFRKIIFLVLALSGTGYGLGAQVDSPIVQGVLNEARKVLGEVVASGASIVGQATGAKAGAAGTIESGFSPEGSAEALVLRVISSARSEIRLSAYSFTSPRVTAALLAASRRGVRVHVVVDGKSNLDGGSRSALKALELLRQGGVDVRSNWNYAIHHDKFIVSDNETVQTGSFNYSNAAARSNSENVIVIWKNPELARSYARHWTSRYEQARPLQ